MGSMFSGALPEVVESMARFGRGLGMAFQIADDLLDLLGEERITGKSLGTDAELQKMTLPLIRLLRRSEPARAGRVRQILTAPGNHKREALRPLLEERDAVKYSLGGGEEVGGGGAGE